MVGRWYGWFGRHRCCWWPGGTGGMGGTAGMGGVGGIGGMGARAAWIANVLASSTAFPVNAWNTCRASGIPTASKAISVWTGPALPAAAAMNSVPRPTPVHLGVSKLDVCSAAMMNSVLERVHASTLNARSQRRAPTVENVSVTGFAAAACAKMRSIAMRKAIHVQMASSVPKMVPVSSIPMRPANLTTIVQTLDTSAVSTSDPRDALHARKMLIALMLSAA